MIFLDNKLTINKIERPIGITIGMPEGIINSDEVIALSILEIESMRGPNLRVIRSDDLEFLKKNTDLLINIGNGEFDYYSKSEKTKRESGVEYGLVGELWKKYGHNIVSNESNKMLTDEEIEEVVRQLDTDIFEKVDLKNHFLVKSIESFNPNLVNPIDDYTDTINELFQHCVSFTVLTLSRIIKRYIYEKIAQKEISSVIKEADRSCFGNVLFLSQCETFPWEKFVISYNDTHDDKFDFVKLNSLDREYVLCSVPQSREDRTPRISLPDGRRRIKFSREIDLLDMCDRLTQEFKNSEEQEDKINK